APLLLEKSRQAQFLKPMAIAIAYGIGFATVLTLLMLPLFLSFGNFVKVLAKLLWTGERITKEEVERAIKEQKEEEHMIEETINHQINGTKSHNTQEPDSEKVLEETTV
ncbi:MAG: hypothetical protein AAFY00_07125, partial [Bacteroidota bacterium]